MIKRVKLVSIPVRDQQKALEFYTEKLGFQIVSDTPFGDGQRWIQLGIPGADTHVVLFAPPEHQSHIGTFLNVVFGSDDVRKTYDELKQRGVVFSTPPTKEPWGTYSVFQDPDGNQIMLSSLP